MKPAGTSLYHLTAVAPPSSPPPVRSQSEPLRIPVANADIGELEVAYVSGCRRSSWVSSVGPFVSRFEEALATACGCRFAVAASNGTAARHLALLALGVGPGNEVLVPDLTFVSTANASVPLHQLPPYAGSPPRRVADWISRRGLRLPSGSRLSAEQIHEIAETIAGIGRDGGA